MELRYPRFLFFIFGFLASGAAETHPFGSDFFSHRTRVSISTTQVAIDYLLEIPTRHLNHEIKTSAFEQQLAFQTHKIEEIRRGLDILVNGQPIELQQVDLGKDNVRARAHSYLYELRLEGRIPDMANTLSIKNQNYPDERAYFRIDWQLAEPLEVTESSLLVARVDKEPQNHSARWWMDESLRDFSMRFQAKKKGTTQRKVLWVIGLSGLVLLAGLTQFKLRHAKTGS
jgi:hypothetical protein